MIFVILLYNVRHLLFIFSTNEYSGYQSSKIYIHKFFTTQQYILVRQTYSEKYKTYFANFTLVLADIDVEQSPKFRHSKTEAGRLTTASCFWCLKEEPYFHPKCSFLMRFIFSSMRMWTTLVRSQNIFLSEFVVFINYLQWLVPLFSVYFKPWLFT